MLHELLYVICEIRRYKPGNSSVTVYELLNVLHDLWVNKGKAIASDYYQVLDALKYMHDVLDWIEYNEKKGIIKVKVEGEKEYQKLKASGWHPFLEEVAIIP